jgi:hypothetical protein
MRINDLRHLLTPEIGHIFNPAALRSIWNAALRCQKSPRQAGWRYRSFTAPLPLLYRFFTASSPLLHRFFTA